MAFKLHRVDEGVPEFVVDKSNNIILNKTGFSIGSLEGFWEHIVEDGDMTIDDVIEHTLDLVNCALAEYYGGKDEN